MARRILFTAERFRKKLQELKKGGYVLRQDSVICGGTELLSSDDLDTLRELGVEEKWLRHPISEISMYFYTENSVKKLSVEPNSSGVARILFDNVVFSEDLVRETIDYVIEIEDTGDGDASRYLVLGSEPIFRDLMIDYSLLPSSLVLWDVFNVYVGDQYEVGEISCIPQTVLEKIVESLSSLGFEEKENGAYVSPDGRYWVAISLLDGIKVKYRDSYMCIPVSGFQMEMAEELGISDFATRYYNDWSYRLRLVDGNIDDSVFKFDKIDLEDVLRKLHMDNYTLDSIGLVHVRSWVDSVTVCGFKNINDFVYTIFYFDKEKRDFLLEIVSSPEEVSQLQVDETVVPLIHVTTRGFKEVSTFIHGFDLGNFKEYDLV